jgi:FkbM family methyltransferase
VNEKMAGVLSRTAQVGLRTIALSGGEVGAIAAERIAHRIPFSWDPDTRQVVRRTGVVFILDLRDNVERTLYYTGFYDRALHRFLLAEIRRGDTFIDVGAHVGLYALPVARQLRRAGGGNVFAFEPSSDTSERLHRLAIYNRCDNLTVVRAALGETAAVRPFRASTQRGAGDAGTRSLFGAGEAVEDVTVQAFDDWSDGAKIERIDVVKVDVEGGEYQVLQGMHRSIARHRPRCLVVEVQGSLLHHSGVTPDRLEKLVADFDYCADGPAIADVAAGRRGHLGANVVLRPREMISSAPNRNRSPRSYLFALKIVRTSRNVRRRLTKNPNVV